MTGQDDLRRRAMRGIGWVAIEKWGVRLVSLGVFVILTRTVAPEAFGLISITSVVITLLLVFVDAGFQKSLIQRDRIDDVVTSTAFWVSLLFSACLYLGLFLLAPVLEDAYSMVGLATVLRVVSVGLVVNALAGVPAALLERELKFKDLALRNLVGTIAGAIIAVPLALSGLGVWALVAQTLSTSFFSAVVLWLASRWRPKFTFSFSALRELWKFGASVLGIELLNKLQDNLDKLIIGAIFGEGILGIYYVAQRLILIVSELITTVIAKISLSTFSRMQKDSERLGRAFSQLTFASGVVAVPIFGTIAVFADVLIPFISGAGWAEAVPIMQLLAVASAFAAVLYFDKNTLLAVGESGKALTLAIVEMLITVALTVVAAPLGITAFAAVRLVRLLLVWPYRQWLLAKFAGIKIGPYLLNVLIAFGAFTASLCVVAIASSTPWRNSEPALWVFALPVAIMMLVVYYATVWGICGESNRLMIRRSLGQLKR